MMVLPSAVRSGAGTNVIVKVPEPETGAEAWATMPPKERLATPVATIARILLMTKVAVLLFVVFGYRILQALGSSLGSIDKGVPRENTGSGTGFQYWFGPRLRPLVIDDRQY